MDFRSLFQKKRKEEQGSAALTAVVIALFLACNLILVAVGGAVGLYFYMLSPDYYTIDGVTDNATDCNAAQGILLLGDGGNYGANQPDSMQNIAISNIICNSRIGITVAGFLTDSVIDNVKSLNPSSPAIVVRRENGMKNVSTHNISSASDS